jgi:hypothetical protein
MSVWAQAVILFVPIIGAWLLYKTQTTNDPWGTYFVMGFIVIAGYFAGKEDVEDRLDRAQKMGYIKIIQLKSPPIYEPESRPNRCGIVDC